MVRALSWGGMGPRYIYPFDSMSDEWWLKSTLFVDQYKIQNTKYKIYPNSSTFVDQWSHLPFNWLICSCRLVKLVRALSWGGMGPTYPFDYISDQWSLKSTLFVDQYKILNTKYKIQNIP